MALKQLPLIVVLGTTACGKSRLAIDLAKRFGGDIISADSMQVYRGLDIATNKVTPEEQGQARHHLINIINPDQRFSVVDFQNKALSIIDTLFDKNLLPIVVGGTHYYIESVLWSNFLVHDRKEAHYDSDSKDESKQDGSSISKKATLLDTEIEQYKRMTPDMIHNEKDCEDIDAFFKKPLLHLSLANIPSQKLWDILNQVDPQSATMHHSNNKRKIIRCLQVIQSRHSNYSNIIKKMNQIGSDPQDQLGGPLRYQPTCVFWLYCDEATLKHNVDDRVDQMIDRGLIAELEEFHKIQKKIKATLPTDNIYQKGVLQTIGFKEFHHYLSLDDEAKASSAGSQMLQTAITELKQTTLRYSKQQIRWIIRRLTQAKNRRELPTVYKLNTTLCKSDDDWNCQIQQPAISIVKSYLDNSALTEELSSLIVKQFEPRWGNFEPAKFTCQACNRTLFGSHHIQEHLESKSHKVKVSYMQKADKTFAVVVEQQSADIL